MLLPLASAASTSQTVERCFTVQPRMLACAITVKLCYIGTHEPNTVYAVL
jgi:hypothetical protein